MTLLGIKLKQTQQLDRRLQQSLRVLQMSGIELEREVEDWLSDNPLLERKDTDEFSDAGFSHYTAPARQIGGDEGEDMLSNIAGEQDFKQYLHAQVCEHPLSDQESACVHILIDFLDEQGYLTDSIEDILDHTPLEWMLDEAMLKQALTALKKFDPAGVAAADLNESLILQIERLGECAAKSAALHIVRNALDSIDGNRSQTLARIKKRLPQTDGGTLEAALDLIASLNPFPAAGFASSTLTPYIRPDVRVEESKDGWTVSFNEDAQPALQLNREYCGLMPSEGVSPEWKEKIGEARQYLDALELRKATVVRLAEYIVKHQADFFTFGEIGLVPLLMKDAAAELGVAESTVSRAANQKYLSCPRGVFPLHHFFTSAVQTGGSGEIFSQTAAKAVLSQLIDNEDRHKPHTDETIVRLLKLRGIEVSRRTVAKYRESLGIPAAHRRKTAE
ncbi:RNA polymerase sigma-54 factor [Neisseria lactamica ATCC 23970]|uniref:RNA polymerase sigma-54 factor n=1 Tax=Neisseria lactamica ATCC 23970 TaxID=546265 RepID=D0W9W6_NEILA|nr:RNA polymerase factor sigma-54 [Neisseria lactamica]EEZ75630.1 RNA polymerase sigma-54 factor [Neisseria lactamica ATCC 23970]KFJ35965.1 RNA polymerase sigma-54 factor [Neisseria lactamica ATCC 23970]VTQ48915.1 rna polymerase sigma-54 factor rpon [Neisseria lactamica]